MEIRFTKLSDARHRVTVRRRDGSVEEVELDTRSYLRHDLAHLVAESELGLRDGVWGSVARGGSLAGEGLDGADMGTAESLAGRFQILLRTEAGVEAIRDAVEAVVPGADLDVVAERVHERFRQLRGHWAATAYGSDMVLEWPDEAPAEPGRPREQERPERPAPTRMVR